VKSMLVSTAPEGGCPGLPCAVKSVLVSDIRGCPGLPSSGPLRPAVSRPGSARQPPTPPPM
jgi:hypothetical protein